MKKKTLSLSLMLLVGAASLSGCSASINPLEIDGKDVLFSVNGTNVYAEDILGFEENSSAFYSFLKTSAGKVAVYDAVEKTIVQQNYPVTDDIRESVDASEMADWDEKVQEYVDTYGVTSRKAESTLLEEAGFESRDELYESYLLKRQKEKLWEQFDSDFTQPYVVNRKDTTKTLIEQYVENAAPMIVKHILVKVGDSNVRTQAAITETEADNLGTVLQRLAKLDDGRNSFSSIASEESEDGSAVNGGNLGIMDTYTSFVSEFKLGLYVAEAINNKDNADYNLKVLGINEDVKDMLFGTNGVFKNYAVESVSIASLGDDLVNKADDLAEDKQLDVNGKPLAKSDYDVQKYPRNEIFNEYFNFPGIKYIKDAQGNVLKDENKNPIVMVRSNYGIHFLSITWSALDHTGTTNEDAQVADNVQYLMYGKKASDVKLDKTYVKDAKYNVGYATASDGEDARENEVEGRIQNYIKGGYGSLSVNEKLYDFEVFNYYFNKSKITYSSKVVENALADYMSLITKYTEANIEVQVENTWDAYVKKIEASYEMHDLYYKD